jgi:hypothetical protein
MQALGISAEDGEKIIYRLGSLLVSEHEKLFGSYWRQVFGPPSSLMHLRGNASQFGPQTLSREDGSRIVAGPFFVSLFISHVYFFTSLSLSSYIDMRAPILSPRLE